MATVLGKRKKPSPDAAASRVSKTAPAKAKKTSEAATIQDIFRQHFEAQFKPLAEPAEKPGAKGKMSKKGAAGDPAVADRDTAAKGHKPARATVVLRENESDDSSDEDDGSSVGWSGLSDDMADDDDDSDGVTIPRAAEPAIEVVDYSTADADDPKTTMTKHERKLYLSSRTPSSFDSEQTASARKTKNGNDDGDAAAAPSYKDAPELLANDLALQRLISESHLLAGAFALPSSFSTSSAAAATLGAAGGGAAGSRHKSAQPFAAGRLRQKATDLRVQAAANKAKGEAGLVASGSGASGGGSLITRSNASDSIFTQKNMPMAMRKGIAAAAAARETRRRQEARESGIVLERPAPAKAKSSRKRLRAVDAPAVGRLRGSELRLRERDVRAIEGPKKTMGSKRRRR